MSAETDLAAVIAQEQGLVFDRFDEDTAFAIGGTARQAVPGDEPQPGLTVAGVFGEEERALLAADTVWRDGGPRPGGQRRALTDACAAAEAEPVAAETRSA